MTILQRSLDATSVLNNETCAAFCDPHDYGQTIARNLLLDVFWSDMNLQKVYCLNPAQADGCFWGLCPQPDISGPLVTLAVIITHFGLAALMWLQHDVSTAFWSHIYTVLAILITTFITMASGQLARSHAYNAALLIGSPPALYIWISAARACVSHVHDEPLYEIMLHIPKRSIALLTALLWITLIALVYAPDDARWFIQADCEGQYVVTNDLAIDQYWAAIWPAVIVPWLFSLLFSRLYNWAKCSRTWSTPAEFVHRVWSKAHPSLQLFIFILSPSMGFIKMFLIFEDAVSSIKDTLEYNQSTVWDVIWQLTPPAFMLYTWFPLYIWVVLGFWKKHIVWKPVDTTARRAWAGLHGSIRFVLAVGLPCLCWSIAVLRVFYEQDVDWITYGQVLALLATLPVVVSVSKSMFWLYGKTRQKPKQVHKAGLVLSPLAEAPELPGPAHKLSTRMARNNDAEGGLSLADTLSVADNGGQRQSSTWTVDTSSYHDIRRRGTV